MFILHLLPDALLAFIVDAVLLLGIVSTILTGFFLKHLIRFIPTLAPHVKIAQIISVVVLLAGVYFKGGYSTEMAWRERVREVEAKLAQAEQQAQEANARLENKSQEKVKIIQGRQVVVRQYIDREITKYDNQCVIPREFVKAHNDSAEAPKK